MKALLQKIRRILKDRRTRQMLTRFISVTAAVVVFVTTYALVLPAITMETEAQCGIEAHQHSDECYTDELVCEIPESPGHAHTDACYELSQVLVCETPEHEHSVDNGCYDEDGNLICELSEHHHTVNDGCYKEVKELVCDIPESEGHTHDFSCYKKVLTCGKEVHTHSTACYHIDAASRAATEAAAVASTESAAIAGTESMMSTKASTASEGTAFADNLPGDEIDESNIGTIGTATSADTENADTTSADANAAGADLGVESGTWTPAEETVDSALSETDGGAEGSTASATSSSTTSSISSTASTTEKATEENAGYVPVLDELNINAVLNDHTGIYYYHPESDFATDSNEASTESSDGPVPADNNDNNVAEDTNDDTANVVIDGTAIPAEDWHRIPNNTEDGEITELGESDFLRVYLAYTIPAGSLDETNTVAHYRLPENIRLTDDQINTINSTVNGIAGQYMSMDTLEILDPDMYNASLGIEAVEGTRTPDQDIQDYLNDLEKAGREASEYINATVRVENVFNEDSGDYEGQDLVFTFTPYSILKNRHEYDKDGQPTKAGEELRGWVSLDLTTDEIEWIATGNGDDNDDKKAVEKTADIVFVEEDREFDTDEISTKLKLVEKTATENSLTDEADKADADAVDESPANKEETSDESAANADTSDSAAFDPNETVKDGESTEGSDVIMPAMSFTDSIKVVTGKPAGPVNGGMADAAVASAAESLPEEAEVSVRVEADEGTFPAGTTMVLKAVEDLDAVAEAVTETVENNAAVTSSEDAHNNSAEDDFNTDAAIEAETDPQTTAVPENTNKKPYGFQAVDITFLDKDGNEIEPAKPVRVALTSEIVDRVRQEIQDAGENRESETSEESDTSSNAGSSIIADPVVVHVDDNGNTEQMELVVPDDVEPAQGKTEEELLEEAAAADPEKPEVEFEAGSFSVYAIVYTVDFHYEIDGKEYSYSIDGGAAITLSELLPILGIIADDVNTEINEVRAFLEDVDTVTFSNPEYVLVKKYNEETSVGVIEDALDLKIQYSAEVTEARKEEYKLKTVQAGDWALISVQPFTTEETLTITMKDGQVIIVNVTDNQVTVDDTSELVGKIDAEKNYIIYTVVGNAYHVLKADGTTQVYPGRPNFDELDNNYRWHLHYIFTEMHREPTMEYTYFFIRPANVNNKSIALNVAGTDLVQNGTNNIALLPQFNGTEFTGFVMEGYDNVKLADNGNQFVSSSSASSLIQLYEQEPLPTYNFTVVADDTNPMYQDDNVMGYVSGIDKNNQNRTNVAQFSAITNTEKRNSRRITAVPKPMASNPSTSRYAFDHWELDGNIVYQLNSDGSIKKDNQGNPLTVGATIEANTLVIPNNESVLKAVFKYNGYTSDNPKGRVINPDDISSLVDELRAKNVPLDPAGCSKTAEVYDYENRIYRVDLTSRASLATFAGIIDLGFILDVSASMLFPSKLKDAAGVTPGAKRISTINNNNNWQTWGLSTSRNQSNPYYIIANENNTATVCKLFYDSSDRTWKLSDSSDDTKIFSVGNNPAKQYYSQNKSYVIKDADDFVTAADLADSDARAILRELGIARVNATKNRAFYLQNSINGTIKELNRILEVLAIAADENSGADVRIAWNTFKNYISDGEGQTQYDFETAKGGSIKLDYDKNAYGGGTSTDIAILDAAGVRRSDVPDFDDYSDGALYVDWQNRDNYYNSATGLTKKYKYLTWDTNNGNRTYTDKLAGKGFQWDSNYKYAVLITDGAPQRGGLAIDDALVRRAAQELQKQGVKLITIGLSMADVAGGEELLFNLSSLGNDNYPLFYSASSGDELQEILNQIIRGLIQDAAVQGTITDTVHEAFYPVNKDTGLPLQNNDVIDLDGKFIRNGEGGLTQAQKDAGYGVIHETDGSYQVIWTEQNITTGTTGWHGTVFVKAKEDLLGGNGLQTNEGMASIEVVSYSVDGGEPVTFMSEEEDTEQLLKTREVEMESPRVNVNELSILKNDSEWTVYLGTEVDPKEQLRKLYENILVEEVVTKAKDTDSDTYEIPDITDTVNGGGLRYSLAPDDFTDGREGTAGYSTDCETYRLADLIRELIDNLIEKNTEGTEGADADQYAYWSSFITEDENHNRILNWNKFIEEAMKPAVGTGKAGIYIPYHVHGISDGGYIQITLNKEIVDDEEDDLINKSPHRTTVLSEIDDNDGSYKPVEKYSLNILYEPDYFDALPIGQHGTGTADFHTGDYGTNYQGHAAGNEDRTNTHIINVFARDFEIIKTDMESTAAITNNPAQFKLYRKASADEITSIQQQEDAAEEARRQGYIDAGKEDEYDPADRAPSRLKKRIDFEPGYDPAADPVFIRIDKSDMTPAEIEALKTSLKNQLFVDDPALDMTTSTADGTAKLENLPMAPDNIYYMVETKAPDKYSAMPEPLKVCIDFTDVFWDLSGANPRNYITDKTTITLPDGSTIPAIDSTTGKPVIPYNWDQEYKEVAGETKENAKIVVKNISPQYYQVYYKPVQVNKGTESEPQLEDVSNKYYIRNETPGVELPASGGPGTALIYFLGFMLTVLGCLGITRGYKGTV